jgi:DNA end-binding protein Ku
MAPPRAIWTGSISFGLVNAPVRMYTATSEKTLRFNQLHQTDGGRIGYQKVCKVDNEVVPADEIVRAYDVGGGEFVEVTDEDFASAAEASHRVITIHDFVPADQIDPIYFEKTYYLGPQDGAGEAIYALLAQAMEQSGLSAVATYVHHDREHLGCLRIRDGVITLERMYFADEIRAPEGLAPAADKVDKRQLAMANDLIKAYTGDFDPTQYTDTYRERLLAVIEAKRSGQTVTAKAAEKTTAPPDLMAALTASLDQARDTRAAKSKPPKAAGKRPKAAAGAGGAKAPARKRRSA